MSISLCVCMSTMRPKCLRKSAPRMGCCTSARMKIHGSDLRRPRLRVRERLPYVRMGVSFTAMRVSASGERRSAGEGGIALTSDPVSTRKCVRVVRSVT